MRKDQRAGWVCERKPFLLTGCFAKAASLGFGFRLSSALSVIFVYNCLGLLMAGKIWFGLMILQRTNEWLPVREYARVLLIRRRRRRRSKRKKKKSKGEEMVEKVAAVRSIHFFPTMAKRTQVQIVCGLMRESVSVWAMHRPNAL